MQHCRNCGYLVCERCSKKRFLLPHLDSKRVRVCDMCFVKLNENITSGKIFRLIDIVFVKFCFSS